MTSPFAEYDVTDFGTFLDGSDVTELPEVLHYAEYSLLELRGVAAGPPALLQQVEAVDEAVDSAAQHVGSVLVRGEQHLSEGRGRRSGLVDSHSQLSVVTFPGSPYFILIPN